MILLLETATAMHGVNQVIGRVHSFQRPREAGRFEHVALNRLGACRVRR